MFNLNKEDYQYFKEYIEENYNEIVVQYETENEEDHVRMMFENYPLRDTFKNSIIFLFSEYLLNLYVIRNYEGSKLTKEELEYLEQLIRKGMILTFQIANKDTIEGSSLNHYLKFVYDIGKENMDLDFLKVELHEDNFLSFEFED